MTPYRPHAARRVRGGRRVGDDRMLPLINVVFLLLVFFMVAGHLAASDPFELDPVYSLSDTAAESGPVTITVGATGGLALDGQILQERDLLARVAAALMRDETREFRVKSDARAEAARVARLLERLRDAGVRTVKLVTAKRLAPAGAAQ